MSQSGHSAVQSQRTNSSLEGGGCKLNMSPEERANCLSRILNGKGAESWVSQGWVLPAAATEGVEGNVKQ